MLADGLDVVIGVDTHKRTHAAAVVSVTGVILDRVTVPADPAGYRRLAVLGAGYGRRVWAIEGTGSYGTGLTTLLLSLGEKVVEVDRPARPSGHMSPAAPPRARRCARSSGASSDTSPASSTASSKGPRLAVDKT